MAIFDFVKDLGEKLFHGDEKAAERIEARIRSSNPGVTGLEVEFEKGVVTLSGRARDIAAVQKTVLIAGNVKGVKEVRIDDLTVAATRGAVTAKKVAQAGAVEYYTIGPGDTLSTIAQRYYGDANAHRRLFEANREVIQDPDRIYPGQTIRIPRDTARS